MIFDGKAVRGLAAVLLAGVLMARAQLPDDGGDTHDVLVYRDGDRVRGELVEKTFTLIIFRSERFGELRVPVGDAVIIKGEAAHPPATASRTAASATPPGATRPVKRPVSTRDREEEEKLPTWNRFYPAVLTAKLRDFFGPWHGRLMFSNELVTDTAHRDNIALEGKLARKFTKDAVDLSVRYDYDQVNGFPATDDTKGVAAWRHDFAKRQFTQYRPTIEWDRGSGNREGYVLLRHEIGYGLTVLTRATRRVRVGVSENVFEVWGSPQTPATPRTTHGTRVVPALFDEAEFALPWRISVTQRGMWYPDATPNGWEDHTELNKKLTETLSVGLSHEIRRRSPDARDYERTKLLLGLDF